ncbi:hypothetical protein HanIR_Chr13g0651421 [Helianthus annuus]|uniref:uncharacterized protein LOC118485395 n=1 Tax=Helianthus annuus TaxID=4232 RepID=UPI001652F2D3|nr:uncharacterized protein LOC118485395 [Helianthus annuus]KAJ0482217.1 hypothetical protein HanIR_Chr13g0651421 [Helianthus annuus]
MRERAPEMEQHRHERRWQWWCGGGNEQRERRGERESVMVSSGHVSNQWSTSRTGGPCLGPVVLASVRRLSAVVMSRYTAARNGRNSERDGIFGGIPATADVGTSTMEVVRRNHASDDDGLVQIHVRVRFKSVNRRSKVVNQVGSVRGSWIRVDSVEPS